jgi:lon-related putative ATP-dependent protease
MKLELTPKELVYKFDAKIGELKDRKINPMPEYKEVFKTIKTSLEISKEGYNIYLVDDFSEDKIKVLTDYIKPLLSSRKKPKDICYVIMEDEKSPKILFTSRGKELKKALEELQLAVTEIVFEFYNNAKDKEKEEILQSIQRRRTELIVNLMDMAKKEGFDVRPTQSGFSFIPLKEGEAMTEKEYDELDIDLKDDMISKVTELKNSAQDILKELKNIETVAVDKLKIIYKEYLDTEIEEKKLEAKKKLLEDTAALEYLENVCSNIKMKLIDTYTSSYDEDSEKIGELISKYTVHVIVDNSMNESPQVIFEEDPSLANLLGSIEYENHNGNYITDVSLISAGSLLKASKGCLILRANSLLSNTSAYYHLKKTLLSKKVKFDYNRGYLELLSLGGLKPEAIEVDVKIILIGDYDTYDLLYTYDEDFKKIFIIKAQCQPIVENDQESRLALIDNMVRVVTENHLNPLTDEAIKETAKYLSRKASDKRKLCFDSSELTRVLLLANNKAHFEGRNSIESRDIIETVYYKEAFEEEYLENYKDNKILFNIEGEAVGCINGLSVIDTGYHSFGKPIRITCNCYRGEGNIIDVQKESNLSGNIHSKAVNILIGYLNRVIGGYNGIPVDFHLSFEQIYGKIDGDSASVAEIVCIISALSKIPVKQSIAVTGSINQLGEVQAIGGVNEKIEGFFNVCKLKGGIKDKGVLIPYTNRDEVILNSEVEKAIAKGDFHIYVMNTVEDALSILMSNEQHSTEEIFGAMSRELRKYGGKK